MGRPGTGPGGGSGGRGGAGMAGAAARKLLGAFAPGSGMP
jgi:ribosomal protein L15